MKLLQNCVPCDGEAYKKQTYHLYIQPSGPNFVCLLDVDYLAAPIY